ncbi:uncharacterized protein LOC135133945 [Zophobas morio]|uniref:uncharacterized protein LOC135133945 n=1 Tax=Zophobas morio TaxID=2755281 RepID=UPI003083B2C1
MTQNTNYSEDSGYVNIHGHDIRVFVCEKTGLILVPIDELKAMGFRIYRKSQYSRLLIDDNQFTKEFDLYMLQCAQTYMFEKKIVFKENDILENINKCKAVLTGSHSEVKTPPSNITKGHVLENSVSPTITTNLREPLPATVQNLQNDRKFRGFTPNKSPASSVKLGENKADFKQNDLDDSFDLKVERNERNERKVFTKGNSEQGNQGGNGKPRNTYNQKKANGSNMSDKLEVQNSFDRNNTSEYRKPLSPKASTDNIPTKYVSKSNGSEPKSNFIKTRQDYQPKRDFENNEEPVQKLGTIELNRLEHKVLVSFIEKPNCVWVQDTDKSNTLLEINAKIKEDLAQGENKVFRPIWNKIYVALSPENNMWYRCTPIKFKPLIVFFVDYGNVAEVKEVLEVSEPLSKILRQAARITFSEAQYTAQVNDNLIVKIKKRYENGTYLVDVKTNNNSTPLEPEPPKTPTTLNVFTKPQPLCKLEDGQKVMLISHSNGKLILRTKECYDKLKQIERALDEEESKAKPVGHVEKGQLVLCKKEKLQRAVVLDVQRSSVEIEFLDYYEKMKVDVSALKHITEALSTLSLTYIVTPVLKGYNETADQTLRELSEKKVKGVVVLSSRGDFDLKLGDELLSNTLKPVHSDRPMLKDFPVYEPPLGLGTYLLNTYQSKDKMYFASGDAFGEYVESVILSELADSDPYEPIVGELCLGLYQENWSRCVILSVTNLRYKVQFVDFGNLEYLKADQLRKLTEIAKEAPILAFCCQLTGLPSTSDVEEWLKENLEDGNNYDINIKKSTGVTYEIEIPDVNEALRNSI